MQLSCKANELHTQFAHVTAKFTRNLDNQDFLTFKDNHYVSKARAKIHE